MTYDPVVLSHARALLASSPEGTTTYIDADLRQAGSILRQAADVLYFRQPVAVMLLGILQGSLTRTSRARSSPGSWMPCRRAVTWPSRRSQGDVAADEVAQGVQRYNEQAAAPVAARTHAEVCRFFAGLDLVEPGVVQVHRWRPGAGDLSGGRDLAIYAGVGRKP